MSSGRRALGALTILGCLAGAPTARAQGQTPAAVTSDNRAMAETLFFTARGMMEAGRYAEACDKLTESYRLDAAAGTLLNLAVCHEKIGKIASAWGEFKQSASDAHRQGRPDREQLASERATALGPELPFLTIQVPEAVRTTSGLVISRAGVRLQSAAWSTELPVDPGQVEIVETAPGHRPRTLTIKIGKKEHKTLVAEPLELAPVERPPPDFWTGQRTTGAILFGTAVLAAGAGAALGVVAINDKKSSDTSCPIDAAGVRRCTQTGVSDMSSATTMAWVSDAAFGLAAVGALLGGYLFLSGGAEQPSTGAGWSVQVGATPTGARASLTQSF